LRKSETMEYRWYCNKCKRVTRWRYIGVHTVENQKCFRFKCVSCNDAVVDIPIEFCKEVFTA